MLYSTREASEASGISVDTVRYYCKIGLVPRVMRDENNYRVFDEHDIAWLRGLRCLRECGMGIDQMREYMELCLDGEGSIPQRKDILQDLGPSQPLVIDYPGSSFNRHPARQLHGQITLSDLRSCYRSAASPTNRASCARNLRLTRPIRTENRKSVDFQALIPHRVCRRHNKFARQALRRTR